MDITCNGINSGSKSSVSYLGADLDQSLTGESMGLRVIKKANSRLKFLYRKGSFLNFRAKKLLITALIQCHFDYGCSFWYSSLTVKTKDKLQTTQNKLIRFALDLSPRTHIAYIYIYIYLSFYFIIKFLHILCIQLVFYVYIYTMLINHVVAII